MSTSKKNQKKWLHQKESLNYLFYTIFLIAITFLCAQPTNLSFFIYCFFQASLEIIGLIFVNDLLKKRKLFFLHKAFISTLFFLLISYIINFILLTLMDTSIAYLFKTFISAGMDSFLVTLRAININASMIFIMALGFILVPALGILFYYFTNKLSEKRPLYIKNSHKLFSAIILIFIILAFDLSKIASNDFNHFNSKKKLPLRTTFLTIKKEPVKFHNLIKPLRKESDIFEKLNNQKISALKKPNI